MKNIEKGSILHLIIQMITISIFGVILYPLFDFLICKFITNSTFNYSLSEYVLIPILFGGIVGMILWILDRKESNNL